ncbi:Ms5788A family Cys-rich leader peptide [Paractinoplanes ferrugineus]|uniref:Ms5788A family Cys-rich leader peptide n=1 Tax=Paractinoplanes ferrugineus TaxID=113564 RepID=UPI0034DAC048
MSPSTRAVCDPGLVPGWWSSLFRGLEPLVGSFFMSPLLTKRRAIDLCRVAACLCRPVI